MCIRDRYYTMYLKNINLKRLKQLVSPLLILLVLVLPVAVVSCEDMMGNYLEKPPGGDVTEDTIFSSRTQVETFLTSIYQMGIHSNLGYASANSNVYSNRDENIFAGACDEEMCIRDRIYASRRYEVSKMVFVYK